jgi:D-glycero-D-manno-heptose 1,7-bisphosphate phosphatase
VHPKLIIFDADGTLRRTTVPTRPCPYGADDWELLPNVRSRLGALGPEILLGVASNQDHVGYGHLSFEAAQALLAGLLREAAGRDLAAPALALCPHRLEVACACRKPAPGLLLQIMSHYGVPPALTLFVGDAETDRQAAGRARVQFAWAADFFDW